MKEAENRRLVAIGETQREFDSLSPLATGSEHTCDTISDTYAFPTSFFFHLLLGFPLQPFTRSLIVSSSAVSTD